jgi:dihydrolipoamide dehydrogenase
VKQNNDGILYLFKKNKVSFFHGRGSFVKAKDGATRSPTSGRRHRDAGGQAGDRGHRLQRPRAAGCAFDEERVSPTTARCASAPCPRSWA